MAAPVLLLEEVCQRRRAPDGRTGFELQVTRLSVGCGERVAVVAPSGAGKSTLLDLLVFAARPSQARLFQFRTSDGGCHDVERLWRRRGNDALGELRKRAVGVVLQSGGLLPFLTVRRNIELPRELLDLPRDGTVEELAERLHIGALLAKLPEKLSVGERQRVAIARALAHRPAVVVADEPTASLDRGNAEDAMALFIDLVRQSGVTLVVASHDPALLEENGFRLLRHESHTERGGTRSCFRD